MAKILLVEDNFENREAVAKWLKMENHEVEAVSTGEDALQLLQSNKYDLIILDWGLPKMSGFELLDQFRAGGGDTPVIFLTGRDDDNSKTLGLDGGADDYISKPFDLRELSARVRSRLRRPGILLPSKITVGNISLDLEQRKVMLDSASVRLTNKEYAVLEFLMRHPNQIFSARDVLDAVWSAETESSEDTVRSCIRNLRRKITLEGQECVLKTIAGAGYTVEAPTVKT